MVVCFVVCVFIISAFSLGKITAVNMVEEINIAQMSQVYILSGNCEAMTPNRKAGPALLQNPIIRAALRLLREPFSTAWEITCAPIGYPPNIPTKNRDSEPCGIFKRAAIGRMTVEEPDNKSVKRTDTRKKGNKDGIKTRIQSSTASAAPLTAVLVSSIKSIMHRETINGLYIFFSNSITSEDSMWTGEKTSASGHIL